MNGHHGPSEIQRFVIKLYRFGYKTWPLKNMWDCANILDFDGFYNKVLLWKF